MRVGDESVRVDRGPTESERARFGFNFKPRLSQTDLSVLTQATPTPCRSTFAIRRDATPDTPLQVGILRKVEQVLGDPDEVLGLCRAKITSKKFDFRNRVKELTDQNQALKRELYQRRERQKTLITLLAPVEAEMSSMKMQVQFLKDNAQEVGSVFSHELKENLKDYHEQYVQPLRELNINLGSRALVPLLASGAADDSCKEDAEVRKVAYDVLKRCGHAEKRRADAAEAKVAALEDELRQTRCCMQDLKKEVFRARKAVKDYASRHGEAEKLLAQQITDATNAREELMRIAQERRDELLQQLAAVKAELAAVKAQVRSEHGQP